MKRRLSFWYSAFLVVMVIAFTRGSHAQNIDLLGSLSLPSQGKDIFVKDALAYVAASDSGLVIVDVSDPANPAKIAGINLTHSAYIVFVEGGYAYVANMGAGLQIVDVSSPSTPVIVNSYSFTASCYDIQVSGNYAFTLFGGSNPLSTMVVVDISDPENPSLAGSFPGDAMTSLFLQGNYVYVAGGDSMRIIDVTEPTNPFLAGGITNYGLPTWDVYIQGDYAFNSYRMGTMAIINIANPESPFWAGYLGSVGRDARLFVHGGLAYMPALDSSIQIVDISIPHEPLIVAGYPGINVAAVVASDHIYTAGRSDMAVMQFTPTMGFIGGTVWTQQTGLPVEGVLVRPLGSAFVDTTGPDGRFFIGELRESSFDLSFSHHDYFDSTIYSVQVIAFDTAEVEMLLRHRANVDVGIASILSPQPRVMEGGQYPLSLSVVNDGLAPETFDVVFEVRSADSTQVIMADTVTLTDMREVSIDTVTFGSSLIPAQSESYIFVGNSIHAGDENPSNDALSMHSISIPPFYLIYGNRDGSALSVVHGEMLDLSMWGATGSGDFQDSVTFVHMPLATNDTLGISRGDALFEDTLVGRWDEISTLYFTPDTTPGWTNLSILGNAFVSEPRSPENFFWTNGDTVLIGIWPLRVGRDTSVIGDTICPFKEGYDSLYQGLRWGMSDGLTNLTPIANYPCIFVLPPEPPTDCPPYVSADVNGSGDATAWADMVYLINYFKGYGPPPPDTCDCPPKYPAADANGNCAVNGLDVTYLHEYWRGWGLDLVPCPDCPEPNPDPLQPPSGVDVGLPDSIIIGNVDRTPILAIPGQTIDIPIWVKNDENVAALNISIAVDTAYASEFVDEFDNFFPPLFDWDEVWFYDPVPDQPSPGRLSRTFGGWAYVGNPPNEDLNTEGVYQHVVDFTVVMNSDWDLLGDTTEVIAGIHPLVSITTFCDSFGVEEWAPTVIPGRIALTEEPIPCSYVPGDINDTGEANGVDVTYAVNYFKGYGPPPPLVCLNCPGPQMELFAAGDVNANCQFNGVDITLYVNFLKSQGPPLGFCPLCPPSNVAK